MTPGASATRARLKMPRKQAIHNLEVHRELVPERSKLTRLPVEVNWTATPALARLGDERGTVARRAGERAVDEAELPAPRAGERVLAAAEDEPESVVPRAVDARIGESRDTPTTNVSCHTERPNAHRVRLEQSWSLHAQARKHLFAQEQAVIPNLTERVDEHARERLAPKTGDSSAARTKPIGNVTGAPLGKIARRSGDCGAVPPSDSKSADEPPESRVVRCELPRAAHRAPPNSMQPAH